MLTYSLFIILIIFLLILNSVLKTKNEVFEILALTLIIFFVGFRFETGYDWEMYRNFFEYDTFHGSIEPGYVIVVKFLRYFFDDFQSLFFFTALATYIFLYLGIKKYTKHSSLAIVLFLLIPGFFLNTLTIMRQELAIAIAFYAFSFLRDNKLLKYLFLMVVAFLIHYSVFLAFLTHFFVFKYASKINYNFYYFGIVFSMIFLGFNIGTLVSYFSQGARYEFYGTGESVGLLKIVILNSMVIFYVYLSPRVIEKNFYNVYLVAFVVMSVIFLNIFSSVVALSRFTYYFKIFEIVLVAELLFIFNKNVRILVLILIFSTYFIFFVNALKTDMVSTEVQNNFIPYKNVFLK